MSILDRFRRQRPPDEQLAQAYLRGDRVFACAMSRTTQGVWIWAPPFGVAATDDRDGLGRLIEAALAASRHGARHPHPDWKSHTAPMLTLAGVRSYKAFAAGARCVQAARRGERLTLTPFRNGGPKEGFVGIEASERIAAAGGTGLADDLLRAFEDAA